MDTMIEVMTLTAKTIGTVLKALQSPDIVTIPKGSHDYTTLADLAAEGTGERILQINYPRVPVITEERGKQQVIPLDGTFFTIDGIDNTHGYKRNDPRGWGTMIAYLEKGDVLRSVVFLPGEDVLVTSQRDKGCFINGERFQFPLPWPLAEATITCEDGPQLSDRARQDVLRNLRVSAKRVVTDGNIARLTKLDPVLGHGHAYVCLQDTEHAIGGIWDFAPPSLIYQEAKGCACDPWGDKLRWTNLGMKNCVFASSEPLAREIIRYTRRLPHTYS